VGIGAIGFHTFFLEFAGLMGVEAILSVSAVGEEGTLNEF